MSAMPPTMSPTANCFVIGAPHAGTVSIDRLLRRHPDVFMAPIQEPCHFCPDIAAQLAPGFPRKRRLDMAAYLETSRQASAWVRSPEAYARLFDEAGGQQVVGECSSFYLSSAAAPELIRIYNPAARVVAVLRRPLDRIRSHYEMDRHCGLVARPLVELVEEELVLGKRAHWGNCAYYIGASRYREQLYGWHEHFPAESICLLSFERMRADPENELRRLFAFLGIPEPDEIDLPTGGRGHATTATGAWRAAGLRPRLVEILKRLLPQRAGQDSVNSSEPAVTDAQLQRLQYLLREEGLDEGWEPCDPVRTTTPAQTTPAWQTPARS